MSLTTELTKTGKVFTWLDSHCHSSAVNQIIEQHNSYLRRSPRIKPDGVVDFARVGMAFTYGFRDWLYPLSESIEQTTAWKGAKRNGCCEQLKQAISEYERTETLYVLLAILDGVGRGEDIPGYLDKALPIGGNLLPTAIPSASEQALISDLSNLLSSINSAWAGNVSLVSQKTN